MNRALLRSKLILTAVRFKSVPPKTDALMKFDTWGARKTFVKEVPLERVENKALWGEQKVVKWSRRKQEMIVVTEKQSEIKEKIDLVRGRISRTFNPFSKKDIIDRHFRYQLRRDQNFYYMANLPYNLELQQEYLQVAGPVGLAAHVLMNKMDCAVYYECQNAPAGTFEWVEDFRAMQIFDPRELNIVAIDARFSKLGFYGLENLKATKNLKYLNASYTRYFDDHCMTRLHKVSETLEYLDLAGSSITVKGLGYLRLMTNLKWINLSDLPNEPDIKKYLPFIKEILPADCTIITSEENAIDKDTKLLDAGETSSFLTSKDIRKLFKLPEAGKMVGTGFFSGRARRKQLMRNFNRKVEMKKIKKHFYRKAAENLPPLL